MESNWRTTAFDLGIQYRYPRLCARYVAITVPQLYLLQVSIGHAWQCTVTPSINQIPTVTVITSIFGPGRFPFGQPVVPDN